MASIGPQKDCAPLKLLMAVKPALLPEPALSPPTGSTSMLPVEITCKASRVLLDAVNMAASM